MSSLYPHRIRLRGPWEYEPLARCGDSAHDPLPAAGRTIMPGRWSDAGLGNFSGRVLFRRRFGYPGRLDPIDRAWLTLDDVVGSAEIWLNGQWLGRHDPNHGPIAIEVTHLLRFRNELKVEVESSGPDGGLAGEVALEIRCTAYLKPFSVSTTMEHGLVNLHVSGEVVGTCDRPLELYVLLDNATVAYAIIEPIPAGKSFHVIGESISESRLRFLGETPTRFHEVRLELIDGATVWYRIDRVIEFPEQASALARADAASSPAEETS